MLSELTIKNFAIIDELSMTCGTGFNVLTGETGAGKSIIIGAVGLLLGSRADKVVIRAGCDMALVEGLFVLDDASHAEVDPVLEQEGLEGDNPTVLNIGRELRPNGRNICRVNGRSVGLNVLRKLASGLVDIHGQSEHLSLLHVREHLLLIDRYAGLAERRATYASIVDELHELRVQMHVLTQDERSRGARTDLLKFQISEIESARLQLGEEELLRDEHNRLANAAKLAELTNDAIVALSEGVEHEGGLHPSSVDMLGVGVDALRRLAQIDPNLAGQYRTALTLCEQAVDLGRELRDYRENTESDPGRLVQVEDRIELIQILKRKYGENIPAVLEYSARAREELEGIVDAEERLGELSKQCNELLKNVGVLGSSLSEARRIASVRLEADVMQELGQLRMGSAGFSVDMCWVDDDEGAFTTDGRRVAFDKNGLDRIEFLMSPNPGEGLQPIAKIASGGETSRLMLAVKGVLARADETSTLIFDEIDQGIGGRLGSVVGNKLWRLSDAHQILCITHLPQLAVYGSTHFRVTKSTEGDRTRTQVVELDGPGRVDELAQMLGGSGKTARRNAAEILQKANDEKASINKP